jgi:hypothetical protein
MAPGQVDIDTDVDTGEPLSTKLERGARQRG